MSRFGVSVRAGEERRGLGKARLSAMPFRALQRSGALLAALGLLGLLSACASLQDRQQDGDRFERVNRVTYRFNAGLDRFVIKPVARTYQRAVPGVVDRRVRNVFSNLRAPIDIANNLLQGKFRRAFSGVGRFLLNSTAGLGGLFDPAGRIGLPRHAEDFGQTLATWGVPPGPYIVLPVIGPSSVRDLFGLSADWQIDPVIQHDDTSERNWAVALRLIVRRAELLSSERPLEISFDEYIYVREAYRQQRLYERYDGDLPRDPSYLQDLLSPDDGDGGTGSDVLPETP